jgi:hypothetical protein
MYDFSISVFGFACLWHLGPKCPISCQEVVLEALASNSGALRFSTLKSQRSFALLAVETAGQRDRGGVKLFNGETGLLEVGGIPHFQTIPFPTFFVKCQHDSFDGDPLYLKACLHTKHLSRYEP